MTDLVIPSALRYARSQFRYIDQTGVTRGIYTGAAQTTSFGGDRVGCTIDFTPHGGRTTTGKSERAQLMAFLMTLRGKQNRILVTDESGTPRGSFSASELLANFDFSNSTTGWNVGSEATIAVTDRVLRVKRSSNTGASNAFVGQALSGLTAYAPYVWRWVCSAVRGIANLRATTNATVSQTEYDSTNVLNPGYRRALVVGDPATSLSFYCDNTGVSASVAGDYFDVAHASVSRCLLIDAPGNLVTKSDEFDHANWTKTGCTITANAHTAADGTSTADSLVENGGAGFHYVEQTVTVTSSAQDICAQVVVSANNRAFCWLEMSNGATTVIQYFSLSGSGAVGATGSTGANWANRRATVTDLGNGRILCSLIARKTNGATSIASRVGAATADGTGSYTGAGTGAIGISRYAVWPSAAPHHRVQSTTAAVASTPATGSVSYVKGLPASTSGVLLAGDWVEIDGQLKMLTAPLDSDSAGRGYLQFSPPLRRSASDNTPVIVCRPMGRFLFAGDNPGWDNVPGVISTASIDLEEAFA